MKTNNRYLISVFLLGFLFFCGVAYGYLKSCECLNLATENKDLRETASVQQAQITDLELSLEVANQSNEDLQGNLYDLSEKLKTKVEQVQNLNTTISELETAMAEGKVEVLSDSEYEILAKLLYREAGGMTWDGKLYTCSAILNMRDRTGHSIHDMAHDANLYSVAPVVDSAIPNQETYEVIEYVLSGHRVPDICYFRTNHYHRFGVAVCEVDGHYFSKPK